MNAPYRFILEPYKGPSTRHTCPQCGKHRELTRYVDTETGELLPTHVGKCNRVDHCGYHYPPRDYFHDNGIQPEGGDGHVGGKHDPPVRTPYLHQRAEVVALRAEHVQNTLSAYWRGQVDVAIGSNRWDEVCRDYALGTWQEGPLAGAAVFWQVDLLGRVKAGKIMLYGTSTGRRRKDRRSTSFVHFERTGKSAGDLNVEQCLFGEHLVAARPEAVVAVVESEKTALIGAALLPTMVWVATGSLAGFKLGLLQALTGRHVVAFPDLSIGSTAYNQWTATAHDIRGLFASLHVSDLLEAGATVESTLAGEDIGDLLLRPKVDGVDNCSSTRDGFREDSAHAHEEEMSAIRARAREGLPRRILSEAEVAVARMAVQNPAVEGLVAALELDLGTALVLGAPGIQAA